MKTLQILVVGFLLISSCTWNEAPTPPDRSRPSDDDGAGPVEAWYSFEVEREGLPKGVYRSRPRRLNVRYWLPSEQRWVREMNVGADWAVKIDDLDYGTPLRMVAQSRARRGPVRCTIEIVYLETGSGETLHDMGRHSCELKTTVGYG